MILLLPLAHAVDLDARLTTPAGEVKSMTFHDVEASAPPPFQVELQGSTVRVTLGVSPTGEAWTVSAELAEVDRRGRARVLSAPRLVVQANQAGLFRQGARVPIPGTSPVQYREEAWQLDLVVRPTPGR